MSQFLTAKELAERLRVTPATVLTWHRRGWIPSLQAGRRPVLFDEPAVMETLKQRSARREDRSDE